MRLLAGGLPLLRLQIERLIQRRSKLIVFALVLLANGVSIANVFPYAPYLVLHLGLSDDTRKLGFYAGYLMASYQLGQLLSSYPLGKVAKRSCYLASRPARCRRSYLGRPRLSP